MVRFLTAELCVYDRSNSSCPIRYRAGIRHKARYHQLSPVSTNSNAYRTDIDGLRAIAVLSVLFFHIHYSLVPAGYIGVDIFFVISGFLITRIIVREMQAETFSFRRFYARRILRILPAFFTVVLVTLAVGYVLLLPADMRDLGASVRYAVFFASNVFFARDRGYFDAASDELPLLHMWSLSVEEQFYFLWPLLLAGLFFAVRRFTTFSVKARHRLFAGLAGCLILICFVWTQLALERAGSNLHLYFLLQTRFGELMIGALAAFLGHPRSTRWTGALSLAGLLLIFAPMFLLTRESMYPGYNALAPCLGAALILYLGKCDNYRYTWTSRLLSVKAMVAIGLISYSLYLWHWPVLAYMRYVYGRYALPVSWQLTAIAAALVLAVLSYALVEQTTRRRRVSFTRAFSWFYVLPVSGILAFLYSPLIPSSEATRQDLTLTSYGTDVCHGNFDKQCVRGDPAKPVRVLVTGDSHAAALNAFMDVVGRSEGWSARVLTGSSCSPVFQFDEKVLPRFAWKPCDQLKHYVQANYAQYDAVVFTSFWAFQMGWTEDAADPQYLKKLTDTLRTMAQTVPVYVLSDVPRLTVSPFRLAHFQEIGLHIDRQPSDEAARANLVIKHAVAGIPGVRWVDLTPSLDHFAQRSLYEGKPVYFDDQHLNVYGSTQLGRIFSASQRLIP